MKIIINIAVFSLLFEGCGTPAGTDTTMLDKDQKIELIELASSSLDTKPDSSTIRHNMQGLENYKIMNSYVLDKRSKASLKKALTGKKNFIVDHNRSCEFIAKYAIRIDGSLAVLLSLGACPKVQYISGDNSKPKIVDLIFESSLEREILGYLNKQRKI